MGDLNGGTQFDAGRADGIQAERARIVAILESDEAKDRTGLAMNLALHTDTDVAAAKRLMALAGKEPKARGSQFAEMMARVGNPKIGVDGADDLGPSAPTGINAHAIYAARKKAMNEMRENTPQGVAP